MGPNPTALIVLVIAILALIVAFKGTQDNFIAAALGRPPSWSPTQGTTGNGSFGEPPPSSGNPQGSFNIPGGPSGGILGPGSVSPGQNYLNT